METEREAVSAEQAPTPDESTPPILSGAGLRRRGAARWALTGMLRVLYRRWTRVAAALFPEDSARERWAWIAQRLLNAQQPGSLAHRTMSLPLAINGRLVEFQVALFDVSVDAELRPELRQRSLRIALDLDQVGRIEILARVVDRHVVLNVLAASDSTAAAIGDQDSALARALANLGWTVDAVSYEVRPSTSGNALVRTVMERLVAGDNFNLVA